MPVHLTIRKDHERQEFSRQLSDCVSSFDVRDQVLVMGNSNAKLSNSAVKSKMWGEGVFSKVNGCSEDLVELCGEK